MVTDDFIGLEGLFGRTISLKKIAVSITSFFFKLSIYFTSYIINIKSWFIKLKDVSVR